MRLWMSFTPMALALAACASSVAREPLGPEPGDVALAPAPAVEVAPAAREVLIGQMCPTAAAGGPALVPLVVRKLSWASAEESVVEPLARRSARSFSVLAWDGRRAGVFSPVGTTSLGAEARTVAIGSYAGAPPCQGLREGAEEPELDAACQGSLGDCGLAVAALEPGTGFDARPYEENPDPPEFIPAGACATDGKLLVDIDGDRRIEAYELRQFRNPERAPAEEVGAVEVGESSCESAFAFAGALPADDPRDWRGMDVLAVVDLDDDGRRELVLAYRYGSKVTWAIYSVTTTPARLDLVAEAVAL